MFATIDVENILGESLRQISTLTNAECVFFSPAPDFGRFVQLTAINRVPNAREENRLYEVVQASIHEVMQTDRAINWPAGTFDGWSGELLILPMRLRADIIGALVIAWQYEAQSMLQRDMLQILADSMSVAANATYEYYRQQYYIQSLEFLGVLSVELNTLSEIGEVANRAALTAQVLLNADRYVVMLTDEDSATHCVQSNISPEFLKPFQSMMLPAAVLAQKTLHKESAIEYIYTVSDTGSCTEIPDAWRKLFQAQNINGTLFTLLQRNDQIFGSIWLFYDKPYTATTYEIRLLEILTSQTAVAIENLQLYQANAQHAAALEQAVRDRTSELAIALDQANDADRLKSQLLSTVSHELRTPLAVIKAHSSTQLAYYDRLPKERHIHYLTTINQECDRLADMVSSLLDMSRLQSGMLEIRPMPIAPADMLRKLIETMQTRFSTRKITLELPDSIPPIEADPDRLRQLVANLIENAAKYSPDGTPIEVSASIWEDALEISVKDQGIGLTPDQAAHVFDRFYQAHGNDPKTTRAGVGLGLTICKGLAESMGGHIWCESKGLNTGSRFAFTLPWAGKGNISAATA